MALLSSLLEKTDIEIDQHFGLSQVLKADHPNKETYSDGLTSSEALYSSYKDFHLVQQDAESRGIQSIADLGSGISRMSFLFRHLSSPVSCHSYEVVPERVKSSQEAYEKTFKDKSEVIHQHDLLTAPFPKHDAYFIYLPVGKTLRKIISHLKKTKGKEIILYVIESHGDLLSFLKATLPELTLLKTYPLATKRHHPELHVFSFKRENHEDEEKFIKQTLKEYKECDQVQFAATKPSFSHLMALFDFLEANESETQLIIRDQLNNEEALWLGDLEGFENGARENTLVLLNPPRNIAVENILGIHKPQGILRKLIQKRRVSEQQPLPRKIFLKPLKLVEYSDGSLQEFPE